MSLSRQSVGIYQKTSSHATRQGIFGYSRLSSLSHYGLIDIAISIATYILLLVILLSAGLRPG